MANFSANMIAPVTTVAKPDVAKTEISCRGISFVAPLKPVC